MTESLSTQDLSNEPLWLIDGSGWLYRAYHALPPLTNAAGEPSGAVFGFGNMLRGLLREQDPRNIAVLFDARGKNFRHELDPDYKANRPPVPPELSDQVEPIFELVRGLGLPLLQIGGVEADDVIGTLAKQAVKDEPKREVIIVTGDKDMAQLVNDKVVMLDTMKRKRMDVDGVVEKFGVGPEYIIDLLALMGDKSDNIPGIPGCGIKTAAKWIDAYGGIEQIIENADDVGGKIGEKLRAHLEQLPKSYELARIRCDIELDVAPKDLLRKPIDEDILKPLYQRMDFSRWLDDFDDLPTDDAPSAPAAPEQTEYHTVLSQDAFDAMLGKLKSAELLCFDCETDALDAITGGLVGLSFAVQPGEAWYVPFTHDYMGAPEQLDRAACLEALKPILEDAKIPKVGQHIKYDINVLAQYGIAVAGVAFDTMLESYVHNASGSRHDMDTLASTYLGVKTVKFEDIAGKGKKQLSFNQIDLEQAAPYAAEDADITLRLHQELWGKLENTEGQRHVFETIEMPLVPVLADVERTGVLIDKQKLADMTHEFGERMAELEAKAHEIAGQEFKMGSPAQIGEILFNKMELPVLRKTPKGAPSTGEDVLSELAQMTDVDGHELPQVILDWRSVSKLRSTYTMALPEQINAKTGRVHTSYHQAVANTGRLSSSDPNLQNIPIRTAEGRRIREAFIAPPGAKLVAIDYSQIELRLMAHFSEDAGLIDAFNTGADIHRASASEVWGVPFDDVSAEQRRSAKAINFGLIYGISAFGLARNLNIARSEAQSHMDAFFGKYPGVKDYMDRQKQFAKDHGYVETLYGRRLYLPDIKARNQAARGGAERVAINAPLQGTAADLIKMAMLDIHPWLAGLDGQPAKMIMQVHDELVFEVAEDALDALPQQIADRMTAVADLKVPLVAEVGSGDNWDAAH